MNPAAVLHIVWPYVLQLGGVLFLGWLGKHVKNTSDSARAQALAVIAKDVTAAVIANNPKLSWLEYVKQVVNTLASTTGIPTTNNAVLERAAIGALTQAGLKPGA